MEMAQNHSCDGCALRGKTPRAVFQGLILITDMPFLPLLHSLMISWVFTHPIGQIFCRSMKMYCLVVMLYRQIDDFLILNDDPIRIPKIISVIIKLFYSGIAIRSFSDSQNCNENSASLPSVTS